jgi:two-component system OmpR family response regulator
MRVLLIEDEPDMAALYAQAVRVGGFVVDVATSLDEAQAAVRVARYDLLLLDRRLPDGEGLGALPRLRAAQPGVPVIVLTALDAVPDRVLGLDAGADDYVAKPVDFDELRARIRAALRRPGAGPPPPMECGAVRFDLSSREVWVAGQPLVLKRRELALLESLIRRAGRVVPRDTLLSELYGFDDDVQSNTLDAHVSRLRGRLAEAGARVAIHTVRGVGYLLDRA